MNKKQTNKFIDELNLLDGEVYAGIVISECGNQRHHLILCVDELFCCTWQAANAWVNANQFYLPTKKELFILQANVKECFRASDESNLCYWSSESAEGGKYWFHSFIEGIQIAAPNEYGINARGVRRVCIKTLKAAKNIIKPKPLMVH